MANWRKSIPLILFFCVCAILAAEQRFSPPSLLNYQALQLKSTATQDEINLLKMMLENIAKLSGDERKINVSKIAQIDSINVALVDFQSLHNDRSNFPPEGVVAIGNNVLIVDLNIFRSILLYTFNENLGVAQASDLEANSSGRPDFASTMGAINLNLRLKNLAHENQATDRYGKLIANAIKSEPEIIKVFAISYTFLLAHELYHLRKRAFGFSTNSDSEELRADEFALSIAGKILSATPANSPKYFMELQALFNGFHYFQDKVLAEAFEGFRALDAASIFPYLIHDSCSETKKVPWPLRFNNPDIAIFGDQKQLPLLTSDEIKILRKKLANYSSHAHGHILRRITRVFDLIKNSENELGIADSLQISKNLLAIYDGAPLSLSMIWPPHTPSEVGTGSIEISSAIASWKAFPENTFVRDCLRTDCIVATIGAGYIEIIGKNNKIESAVLMQPSSEEGLVIMETILNTFLGQKISRNIRKNASEQMMDCRLAHIAAESKKYYVILRTINEDGWIEILIESKSKESP